MTDKARNCLLVIDLRVAPRAPTPPPGADAAASKPPPEGPPAPPATSWVMSVEGSIASPSCLGSARLNVTADAFRIDWELLNNKAINYSLVLTLVCLAQIALLFRQLHFSRTPAAASRVSLLCIAQQSLLDATLCIAHLLLCAAVRNLFAAFATVAFFKLVIFCIVEMRYIVVIFQSHDPQRLFNANWNNMRRELAMLHARFYLLLFATLCAMYVFRERITTIVLLGYSFWLPQIVRNCVTEAREPLHASYVAGMSATRLVVPLYVWGYPGNFLHELSPDAFAGLPNYGFCASLTLWVAAQAAVLFAQRKWGARFMIPARLLPPRYNYHRPLPSSLRASAASAEAEAERARERARAAGDLETSAEPADEAEGGLECVICYTPIDAAALGNVGAGRARGRGAPANDYMLTPCDHIFHEHCLQRWMEQKLECPVCRTTLPPE